MIGPGEHFVQAFFLYSQPQQAGGLLACVHSHAMRLRYTAYHIRLLMNLSLPHHSAPHMSDIAATYQPPDITQRLA
jgi:hypothetical protein